MSEPLPSEPREAVVPAPDAPYLRALNERQREAVSATEGPLLVLAGAGTGKTRVLTTRLSHILLSQRAWPNQVLAVTFTNKAAREMRDRVAKLLGDSVDRLWIGTFHALGARILRRHAELIGLRPDFTILDSDDQVRVVRQLIEAAGIDAKRWPPKALHVVIERFKDRGLTPDKVSAADVGDFAGGRAHDLYRQYQDRLRALNACDFGDLLLHCLTLFTTRADILAEYQNRFRYILVDEYQDTNVAQYLWLRLLAQSHSNICCVGDDDQSIYSWRGAEVGNILRFERDFPGATIVRLEQNYRSTPDILAAASGLIAHNDGRLGKTLWTERDDTTKVAVRGVWDGEAEARLIADEIETLHRDGESLDEAAVLVRASFQMREFEERFITIGLPYRVIGGPRFYERAEIRDAIAYLRVIAQPDDDLAFERIANVPRRGIGNATMQAVHLLARAAAVSLLEASRRLVETDDLRPQARTALRRLAENFDRWRALAQIENHVTLAETVLDESGYTQMWQASKAADAPGRLENLKEMIAGLGEFDTLGGFLEHISLVMDNGGSRDGEMVNLMTLHAAKGLEFDHVFLPGWEEDVFPNRRSIDEGGLEEERRLAYVGLTRARRHALIAFTANRHIYGKWVSCVPSRFIEELPKAHLDVSGEPGLYGGAMPSSDDWESTAPERPGRGPRYQRLRHGASHGHDRVIEGHATIVNQGGVATVAVGTRIFHQKFGYGKVIATDGDKLEIDFEQAGQKKVLGSFVEAV